VANPGLITYRDRILLAKPERDTPERQRGMRGAMAHELAHQWFGNLVTQAWWDDVWLSEGFATWLGVKTSDLELPVFERSIAAVASRAQIMKADASAEARPVRLEMKSRADMGRVYGGMVYLKGAAILNMLEQWLGPEAFRRGLQTYLSDHTLASATTDDLGAALRQESGVDVLPVLHSFLDQTGFPTIRASAECAFESGDAVRWTIPLCVHGDDGASQCTVLSSKHGQASLGTCPAWVWPNRGGSGYFRVQLTPAMLETVVESGWDQLTAPEKLSLIEDCADSVALLKVLPVIARDSNPSVVNAAYRLLLSRMANAGPVDRAKYDDAVKQMLEVGRRQR
jgi:cytosol alanyl aminopeptidase